MILITGVARSGTSLTTKMLQALGVYLGEPHQINVLYENVEIRQNILKPYLKSIGADPLGQRVLPKPEWVKPDPSLRSAVEYVLRGGPEPRGYKDAKVCLCWQVWAAAFPAAKWVIVRRDAEKIVDSCIRTHFMKAYGDDRDGWRRWVAEHEKRFEEMKAAGLDFIEVRQADVINDVEAFRPVADHCGLTFDSGAIEAAIDRSQWHG